MTLNLGSLAFNANLESGGGTPAWGTELGQGEGYRFLFEGAGEFLTSMVYKSVPDVNEITCPLGKGGGRTDDYEFVLGSVYDKIYVNGIKIPDAKFILLVVKTINGNFHVGRRSIKYNPRMTYHGIAYNDDCYKRIPAILGIKDDAAWFIDEIFTNNQDELHFVAYVLDANHPQNYASNEDRKNAFISKIKAEQETNKATRRHTHSLFNIDQPLQQIFYGAPGTGKSFYIDGKTTDENSIRTTFHPDSDYASFVGAYKPIMEDTTMRVVPVVLNNGASFNQNEGSYSEKRISYKFVPQAFIKAYCTAWKNLDEPYYLVIEEINRGNCAQIFGDLFQLLDRNEQGYSSYAIEADEDIRQFISEDGAEYKLSSLQIEDVWNDEQTKLIAKGGDIANGIKLVLPKNLRIWATMNTSDQSLFPIDSAFKRRWDWQYMPIKYGNSSWMIEIGDEKYSWVDFQKEINKRIFEATESEDKQLGDYFVKADANNIISAKLLLNKVIFYLWNDVCKDGDGDIFKINTDLDYTKELDHSMDEDITFSKFFDDTDIKLQQWMRYLGIKPIQGIDDSNKEDEERQTQIEAGTDEKDAQKVKYSKPIYKTLVESIASKLDGQKLSFFPNGFDWAFTDMPVSYARTTITLDSSIHSAYVKLWIPAASGYNNSRECFEYLKEHNGEEIIKDIAEKNGLQFEELGKKSTNPKPVLGWSMKLPMAFTEENTSANAEKLLKLMTDVRSAFDPIITDFQKK